MGSSWLYRCCLCCDSCFQRCCLCCGSWLLLLLLFWFSGVLLNSRRLDRDINRNAAAGRLDDRREALWRSGASLHSAISQLIDRSPRRHH